MLKFICCRAIHNPWSEGALIDGYAVFTCWDGRIVRRNDLSPSAAHRYVPQLAQRHGIDTAGIFTGRICGKER